MFVLVLYTAGVPCCCYSVLSAIPPSCESARSGCRHDAGRRAIATLRHVTIMKQPQTPSATYRAGITTSWSSASLVVWGSGPCYTGQDTLRGHMRKILISLFPEPGVTDAVRNAVTPCLGRAVLRTFMLGATRAVVVGSARLTRGHAVDDCCATRVVAAVAHTVAGRL